MKSFFMFLVKIFLRSAVDNELLSAVKGAVVIASTADASGDDKMKMALNKIKTVAPKAFEKAGKKQARLLIEAELNRIL